MTVEIVTVETIEFGHIKCRIAELYISDGGQNTYRLVKGDLPLTGDLQLIVDALEPELWEAARIIGDVVNDLSQARSAVKAHRGEALVFDNMVSMTEEQVRQWIRTNGAEDALIVIWRVLRFVVSWIRATEKLIGTLKKLK